MHLPFDLPFKQVPLSFLRASISKITPGTSKSPALSCCLPSFFFFSPFYPPLSPVFLSKSQLALPPLTSQPAWLPYLPAASHLIWPPHQPKSRGGQRKEIYNKIKKTSALSWGVYNDICVQFMSDKKNKGMTHNRL